MICAAAGTGMPVASCRWRGGVPDRPAVPAAGAGGRGWQALWTGRCRGLAGAVVTRPRCAAWPAGWFPRGPAAAGSPAAWRCRRLRRSRPRRPGRAGRGPGGRGWSAGAARRSRRRTPRRYPVGNLVVEGLGGRVDPSTGNSPEEPHLLSPVPPDEPGSDAIQPRPRVAAREVITAPPAEGDQEGLRDQVIGGVGAQPPAI